MSVTILYYLQVSNYQLVNQNRIYKIFNFMCTFVGFLIKIFVHFCTWKNILMHLYHLLIIEIKYVNKLF